MIRTIINGRCHFHSDAKSLRCALPRGGGPPFAHDLGSGLLDLQGDSAGLKIGVSLSSSGRCDC